MQWAGIEEQGEPLTLMIHRLHELGPDQALPLLEVSRHEITVPPVVARRLELAYQREAMRIGPDYSLHSHLTALIRAKLIN